MNKKRVAMVAILLVAVVAVSFAVPAQRFGAQAVNTNQRGYGMFADQSQIPQEMLAYRQSRIDALAAQGTQTYGYGPGMMAQQGYGYQGCDPDDCVYQNTGRGPMGGAQATQTYGRYSFMQNSSYGRGGMQSVSYGRGGVQNASYGRGGMMGGRW